MIKSHSIFITTVIGGVSIIAWVVGGWMDRNTVQLLLGVLFGSFVGVAIAAVALAASQAKPTQTRYVERIVERQQPAQTRVEPQKQLPAHNTCYTVVEQPQTRLRAPQQTIGTSAQRKIGVNK